MTRENFAQTVLDHDKDVLLMFHAEVSLCRRWKAYQVDTKCDRRVSASTWFIRLKAVKHRHKGVGTVDSPCPITFTAAVQECERCSNMVPYYKVSWIFAFIDVKY